MLDGCDNCYWNEMCQQHKKCRYYDPLDNEEALINAVEKDKKDYYWAYMEYINDV